MGFSEILQRRCSPTLPMIRALSDAWKLLVDMLVREYELRI